MLYSLLICYIILYTIHLINVHSTYISINNRLANVLENCLLSREVPSKILWRLLSECRSELQWMT